MTIEMAMMIWTAIGLYLGVGLVFGLAFVFLGVQHIDHAAQGAGIWFRLMILPGVAALWPFALGRLLSFRKINAPIVAQDDIAPQNQNLEQSEKGKGAL